MESAVWGLIGTAVGAVASIGTSWISTRTSSKLQSEKIAEERVERKKAFQRETLLSLQEALHDALRFNALAHVEIGQMAMLSGSWTRQRLSGEINDGMRTANARVVLLIERVVDEAVRSEVISVVEEASKSLFAASEIDGEIAQQRLMTSSLAVLKKIGAALRSNY